MMPQIEGILTIKNEKGELIAIVYNDIEGKKSQIFYTVTECNQDDIKALLEEILRKKMATQ